MIDFCQNWFKDQALRHWLKEGYKGSTGSFSECLSFETGLSIEEKPRRAMVQARQIYVVKKAMELNLLDHDQGLMIIQKASEHFFNNYFKADGSVYHSLDMNSNVVDDRADLYGQAFALFGLAQSYSVLNDQKYLTKAYGLLDYLNECRAVEGGGYTELDSSGHNIYSSNPHMHLLEAAIELMKVDEHPCWIKLGENLIELCLTKFRDQATGLIGENFDSNWEVHRNTENFFMFEPGHQYEWAWLLGEFESLTGKNYGLVKKDLYDLAESKGIHKQTKFVLDEVLSNFEPQKKSSRFWPQCERIKLALQFAKNETNQPLKQDYLQVADEALIVLNKFLNTPLAGLWYDTQLEGGEFEIIPAKGSSFYHIVGAFSEYIKLRKV